MSVLATQQSQRRDSNWATTLDAARDTSVIKLQTRGGSSNSSLVTQRGILLRRKKIPHLARPVAAARRDFKMVLLTASRGNTFVRGTCALRSAF